MILCCCVISPSSWCPCTLGLVDNVSLDVCSRPKSIDGDLAEGRGHGISAVRHLGPSFSSFQASGWNVRCKMRTISVVIRAP